MKTNMYSRERSRGVGPVRSHLSHLLFALSACVAIGICSLMIAAPNEAFADDYSMGPVDITATVLDNGDITVHEQRTFEFDGDFTTVWWELSTQGFDGIEIQGVSLTDENGQTQVLDEVPFQTAWRDSGGPNSDAFSVDNRSGSVDPYVFFNLSDETAVITLDYTIVGGASSYADVGEIYWQFVGAGWGEDSQDVTMDLTLPVPSGEEVIAEDTVRAWGHGTLSGTTVFNDDGTITYTIPTVNSGDFAEARVVFPVSWLSQMPIENDYAYLDTVIAEETQWADEANTQRFVARVLIGVILAVCLLLLVLALIIFFRKGKEYKPQFQEQYWRDVPSDDHPAVLGALWHWGSVSPTEFTATLMSLTNRGVIKLEKGSYVDSWGKTKEDYILTRDPGKAATLTDPIDVEAVRLVFDTIAGGKDSLFFSTITAYGKKSPEKFLKKMESWKGTVKGTSNKRQFFEREGKAWGIAMMVVAALMAIAGVLMVIEAGEVILGGIVVLFAIAMAIIASKMRRRSKEAVELHARCEALRNWLKDFSSLDEAPPMDVKVWDHFLVLAVVFGVADEVIKQLKVRLPEVVEDQSFLPMYMWIGGGLHGGGMSPAQSMTTNFNSAITTATSATSSGGGGGGGFSGGGGFGGGGGGGGAR